MIAIIDYGASNLLSLCYALEKIGQPCKIVRTPDELADASRVILPGVGAASSAMAALNASGFSKVIPRLTIPFLGICLGLQLLAEASDEGNVKCLGILRGTAKKYPVSMKVPQIGWNKVFLGKPSPLIDGIENGSYFYFVNSFYLQSDAAYTTSETEYGVAFSATVQYKNFFATQFHPEKSGKDGLTLLRNFCEKC